MKSGIIVLSLGNGDPDLLNIKTLKALRESDSLFLRTGNHPIVSWLKENGISFSTLDHLYDVSEDFDMLNQKITDYLISMSEKSPIVYAVPDAITDHTVRTLLLNKPADLTVSLIPGISSYDMLLSSSADRFSDTALQIVTATDFVTRNQYDPNDTHLITELDNGFLAGEVKIRLNEMLEDEYQVFLVSDHQAPVPLSLWQLDRQKNIDHRSAVLVPSADMSGRKRFVLNDLLSLMDKLRSESGCPWDRIQTHESLRPYMIEEAWECVASIDQNDMEHLGEELGDLLFQIVFHASIGRSFDEFTMNDVVSSICLKMIRRHPHVFGDKALTDPESVKAAWEKIKQNETGHCSAVSSLDDVSAGLPSLKYASKLFRKLSGTSIIRSGSAPVLKDMLDLVNDLLAYPSHADSRILGRLLMLCSELCFTEGQDGELLLHQAADRLKNNLRSVEKAIVNDGKSLEHLTFEELGVYLKYVEDEIE